ncbi:Cyclin d3 [Quillaja saponaria]|uniref:B-like cyclin n=1 Tax=Quillaja saponaria TaxID=32244 RepID=A0AAD7KUY0_QUISA|nr:Cyclin d3 [Quillaja saponaria]
MKKMAVQQQNEQHQHQQNPSFLLDALYCDEGKWDDEEEEVEEVFNPDLKNKNGNDPFLFPLLLLEEDLFWEDEELISLFSKEKQQQEETHLNLGNVDSDSYLFVARSSAIGWMLKVNTHFGFSALTATLAINYFDRFLSSLHFEREKPWMIQLMAVTCLSLAAKVEETQVPLLLDLQVENTKYVFEAKTIQKMELLVLSTLKWKMHPVTPLSFLDHIIRRLGLKNHLHWQFLRRCEHLLLSVLPDSRFLGSLPSVLATATMLHVIDQIEHSAGPAATVYKNQLLGVLKISKEKVSECYNLILELSNTNNCAHNNSHKRKYDQIPGSPSGIIDAVFNSESSNDSWAAESSLCCSSPEPLFKKSRAQEQQLKRVIVGNVGSPP